MFVPAKGCVLVKLKEKESYVASLDTNLTYCGEVLAVAKGTVNFSQSGVAVVPDTEVSIGDIIFFDQFAHRTFEYEKKEYCIVNVEKGLWGYLKQHDTNNSGVRDEGVSTPISSLPDIPTRD